MIPEGQYKILRRRMASLMNYIDTVAPTYHWLNSVVSIFRLLQFVGPSLCVSYIGLWKNSDASASVVGMISVFWHIVPPGLFIWMGSYINIAIAGLLAINLSIFFWAALRFEKTAALPGIVPSLLTIWINCFGFVMHPIAFELSFGYLTGSILGLTTSIFQTVITSVLAMSLCFCWCLLYCEVIAPTLMFRPTSLIMAAFEPSKAFFIGQIAVTSVIGIGTGLSGVGRAVCLILAAIIYISLGRLTG
jgi:hypothetical protein